MSFVTEYQWPECRSLRHQWEHKGWTSFPEEAKRPKRLRGFTQDGIVVRVTFCLRCTTERYEMFGKTGLGWAKMITRYLYPKGYRFIGSEYPNEDRPTAQTFDNVAIEAAAKQWS